MPLCESFPREPVPGSWALDDAQQALVTGAGKFARERLEPLLLNAPDACRWEETVRLAATLGLATMILPQQRGGLATSRHDLALVIEQFAAGPLERAAALTLSSAALMTLRECDALDLLPDPDLYHYLDGTTSIAPGIADADDGALWVLREQHSSQAIMMRVEGESTQLVVASLPSGREHTGRASIALPGALSIERYTTVPQDCKPVPPMPRGLFSDSTPVEQWLSNAALYLAAMLSGAVRQSVSFALAYAASRQTFRRPLATHQLVAVRLADMLICAHTIHLVLRSVALQGQSVQIASVRSMACHVATEALDVARELVQLCGGHGYVEGLPPAARFQTVHWLALLLMKIEAGLRPPAGSTGHATSAASAESVAPDLHRRER